MVFGQSYSEYEWSKSDALLLVGANDKEWLESVQIIARYVLLRKSFQSIEFVSQWLTYAQDYRIVSDEKSEIMKERKRFLENRHDQTVLSLLAKKWNLTTWPSPEYEWPLEHYPEYLDYNERTIKVYNPLNLEFVNNLIEMNKNPLFVNNDLKETGAETDEDSK